MVFAGGLGDRIYHVNFLPESIQGQAEPLKVPFLDDGISYRYFA